MSNIKINFRIYNLTENYFEDAWEIEGGLSIEKHGLVLTKRDDDEKDDGFRGDYVYFNLFDWLTSVPKLLSGQRCKIDFYDSTETFIFRPDGDVIYFKYNIEGIGSLTENENKRYPNHEDGTPINTNELVLEIITISEKFLAILELKINNKTDIKDFKQALFDAKEAHKSCFGH
ncbi:MAG: hypothetical protein GQ469_04140 [Methanosarcinales archaeon]|nr:hypothetical protein [Methanosarcinales archaeon]